MPNHSPEFLISSSGPKNWHLSGMLDQASDIHGSRPLFLGQNVLTYQEVAILTRRIAAWLSEAGVKRGDRIMIIVPNRVEVALIIFATARLGAIFTIINHGIKPYGFRKIVNQIEPSIIVLDETTSELANEFNEIKIIWLGKTPHQENMIAFDQILVCPDPGQQDFPGIDLDPTCLIYTSGSTGVPRGVIINHDNIRFSVAAIQESLQYRDEDVIGLFLPLSFDYGLYQVFLAIAAGASIYIGRPEFVGPELVSRLAMYKISVLPGVPSLFSCLLKMLTRDPCPLPNLRCVTNTGEHLPQSYIEQLLQLFPHLQIFVMYGLTECKRVSILHSDELEMKSGSVGRPLMGTEAYIVGENGQILAIGEIGELVVRGRHVTMGYWQADDETQQRFRQNREGISYVLYTGDLCRMDEDGFIYFIERKDNQLKHRGFRISPLEIEAIACSIEGIRGAGLVQTKNPDQLHLFVSVNKPELRETEVFEMLQKHLEPFKIPDKIYTIPELPKSVNGKLDRKRLKEIISLSH